MNEYNTNSTKDNIINPLNVSVQQTNLNMPIREVNNISLKKISINTAGTLFVNVDLNYVTDLDNDFPSVSDQPIYIYGEAFNNVVNLPKLLLIASQLFNLKLSNVPETSDYYKYNPSA